MTCPLSLCEHRKQTVNGEPLAPTWLPMTSTVSVFGLLHFSLRTMAGETTHIESRIYGWIVFLTAAVCGNIVSL